MHKIYIICPTTKKQVITNITFNNIRGYILDENENLHIDCPHCGLKHILNKDNARTTDENGNLPGEFT